jgi:Icc-related predicted phosphoesterase
MRYRCRAAIGNEPCAYSQFAFLLKDMERPLRLLAVSDIVEPQLYYMRLPDWMGPVDAVLACGDLPDYYQEFLLTVLNVPCFYVRGNHCESPHDQAGQDLRDVAGAVNLHGRTVVWEGLLLAGLEGSPWYNGGPHQYRGGAMQRQIWRLMPRLWLNRLRTGRYLDILLTHTPPFGVHDGADLTHTGFRSFLPLLRRTHPLYLLHGHQHRYIVTEPARTLVDRTTVINVYGHVVLEVPRPAVASSLSHIRSA